MSPDDTDSLEADESSYPSDPEADESPAWLASGVTSDISSP